MLGFFADQIKSACHHWMAPQQTIGVTIAGRAIRRVALGFRVTECTAKRHLERVGLCQQGREFLFRLPICRHAKA